MEIGIYSITGHRSTQKPLRSRLIEMRRNDDNCYISGILVGYSRCAKGSILSHNKGLSINGKTLERLWTPFLSSPDYCCIDLSEAIYLPRYGDCKCCDCGSWPQWLGVGHFAGPHECPGNLFWCYSVFHDAYMI